MGQQSIKERDFGLCLNPTSHYMTFGKVLNFSMAQIVTCEVEIIMAPISVVVMRISEIINFCKALNTVLSTWQAIGNANYCYCVLASSNLYTVRIKICFVSQNFFLFCEIFQPSVFP